MDTLARLPVPLAVGSPLLSSEADAVPHETSTSIRGVLIGSVHVLDPVGVAVTPAPLATASCVLSSAKPLNEDVGLVGQGSVDDAVERQAPVPDASACGALLASASEPPPESCSVLRRSSDTNPPFAWTFHCVTVCAPAVDDSARGDRHRHQPHRGDPDSTPHV